MGLPLLGRGGGRERHLPRGAATTRPSNPRPLGRPLGSRHSDRCSLSRRRVAPEAQVTVFAGSTSRITLAHEATAARLLQHGIGDIPSWVNEGLFACFVERWDPIAPRGRHQTATRGRLGLCLHLRCIRVERRPLPAFATPRDPRVPVRRRLRPRAAHALSSAEAADRVPSPADVGRLEGLCRSGSGALATQVHPSEIPSATSRDVTPGGLARLRSRPRGASGRGSK